MSNRIIKPITKSKISIYKVRQTIAKLLAIVEGVDFVLEELEHQFGYASTYKKFYRIMHQLVDQDELTRQSQGRYKLTGKGVMKLLPLIQLHPTKDGMVRVLVFDIPEDRKLFRDRFRRYIKMLGFQMHQKSVWVSRYDCEKWLLKVADYYGIKDCVSLYVGKHIW